jgi:hypothetical protein
LVVNIRKNKSHVFEVLFKQQKRKSLEIVMISRLSVGCGDRT